MSKRLLFALGLFFISCFTSFIFTSSVSADGEIFVPSGMENKVNLALNANMMGACAMQYPNRSTDDLDKGETDNNGYPFKLGNKIGTAYTTYGGTGTGTDDASMKCSSWSIKNILNILNSVGFSGSGVRQIICDIPGATSPSSAGYTCDSGDSHPIVVNAHSLGKSIMEKKPFEDDMAYYVGYRMLNKYCSPQDMGILNKDIMEGDKRDGDFTIYIVKDAKGTGELRVFRLPDKGKKLYLWNSATSGKPYETTCKDMIMEHMNHSGADWVTSYTKLVGSAAKTCDEKYPIDRYEKENAACKNGFDNKENAEYCTKTYSSKEEIEACNYGRDTATASSGVTTGETIDDESGEEAEKTCNIDGIGWLVCPVTTFLANISDSVKSRLDGYLRINSSMLTDQGEGSVYSYWSVARDYANILFIFAFLVVIYSQVTNAGISNYGIKKMLPKIIIGIILVNISFYFCAALADISNILGAGSFNFITASADQSATPDQGGFWSHGAKGGAGTFAAIATIILTTGAVMYFALGTLLMGLISVIFIGITTLIFLGVRQAVIIFMIILSPLAFVAWLLPNTEGLFKKWWSTFKMMLMVYPIIGVVYGASNLASQILGKQYGDEGTEDGSMVAMQIVAAVLAFIPMMIVPKVVNKAMSVGGIANAVGNISGRLQGAANKKAGEAASNSTISQYRQHRKNEAAIRRAKKQGGVYTRKGGGANPANWGAGVNRFINKRTGKFGSRRASLADSLEDKEYQQGVDQQVSRIQNDLGPSGMLSGGNNGPQSEDDIRANGASGGAAKYLQDALASGNKEQAAAATKIMLNQGEKGRKQLRGVMAHHQDNHTDFRQEGSVSHGSYQAMQTQINTANLKGTDNVLANAGFSDRTIDDIRNDGGTYRSLDDYQMTGQSADDIRKAIELGIIDQSRAMEMVTNNNLKMTSDKRNILMNHATRPGG